MQLCTPESQECQTKKKKKKQNNETMTCPYSTHLSPRGSFMCHFPSREWGGLGAECSAEALEHNN
jgi:hypothetical protein